MSRLSRHAIHRIAPRQRPVHRHVPLLQKPSIVPSAIPPLPNPEIAALRRINIHDISPDNARDVARTMYQTRLTLPQEHLQEWQEIAKKILQNILAQGFTTAVPEVREMDFGTMVIATVSRQDNIGDWYTQYTMLQHANTSIFLRDCIVLVPYASPRPLDWTPGSERWVTIVKGEKIVPVDASLVSR